MSQFTPHGAAYAHFMGHLPRTPLATNHFRRDGLHKIRQDAALTSRYIQFDRPYQTAWLKTDLDYDQAAAAWVDYGLPRPHLCTVNPQNGHAQAAWAIAVPVVTSLNGRDGPIRFLADVEAGFTRILHADAAYTGLTGKNPLHPDWFTWVHDAPPYSLTDLAEALPYGVSRLKVKPAEYVGEGRNFTLFTNLRLWAYGLARAARDAGNYAAWQQAVHSEALRLNTFDAPLPLSEIRSTANSVAKWTWKNAHNLSVSKLGGMKRSSQKSWNREAISDEERTERRIQGARYTHAVRRNKTTDAITHAIGQLIAQGVQRPSASQVAKLSGVHRTTVARFLVSASHTGQGN